MGQGSKLHCLLFHQINTKSTFEKSLFQKHFKNELFLFLVYHFIAYFMDTVGSVLPRTHCSHEKNYIQLLQLQVEGHRHILRTESSKGVSTNISKHPLIITHWSHNSFYRWILLSIVPGSKCTYKFSSRGMSPHTISPISMVQCSGNM